MNTPAITLIILICCCLIVILALAINTDNKKSTNLSEKDIIKAFDSTPLGTYSITIVAHGTHHYMGRLQSYYRVLINNYFVLNVFEEDDTITRTLYGIIAEQSHNWNSFHLNMKGYKVLNTPLVCKLNHLGLLMKGEHPLHYHKQNQWYNESNK